MKEKQKQKIEGFLEEFFQKHIFKIVIFYFTIGLYLVYVFVSTPEINIVANDDFVSELLKNCPFDSTQSLHYWENSSFSPERLYCSYRDCNSLGYCKSINVEFINQEYWLKNG